MTVTELVHQILLCVNVHLKRKLLLSVQPVKSRFDRLSSGNLFNFKIWRTHVCIRESSTGLS